MATFNSKFSLGQSVAWFMNRGIENPSISLKTGKVQAVTFNGAGATYQVSGLGTSTDHLKESEMYATVEDAWIAAEQLFTNRVTSLEKSLAEAKARVAECKAAKGETE